ncbi:hypothetical protein EALG_01112 [Escherichia coli TA144]|nr:hypothetical protein EALG_01112 [Escherichia coli TA144]
MLQLLNTLTQGGEKKRSYWLVED